jgi:hypothetical protein
VNWGSVADWVSGIGSLSAALVALYVANASTRVRLKGYCGHRLIVGAGSPTIEIVSISVTNLSQRSTTITNIGLTMGLPLRKRSGIITLMQSHISHGIPKTLADGERANWSIELDTSQSWMKELVQKFEMDRLSVYTLRFHVYTSNGGTTTLRPEKELRKMLLEHVAKKKHG